MENLLFLGVSQYLSTLQYFLIFQSGLNMGPMGGMPDISSLLNNPAMMSMVCYYTAQSCTVVTLNNGLIIYNYYHN